MKSIKQTILSKSGQYNFYKDNYYKLLNENKELKDKNTELNKTYKKIKELTENFNLIKPLVVNDNQDDYDLNYCAICGRVSNFIPAGISNREKAKCPYCKTVERHRLLYLILIKEYGYLLKNPIELLHFAPEAPFYKNFSNMENIDYYPVDINSDKYARRNTPIRDEVNIENIPYDNEKFDSIICAHVLEHVTDYMKSMNELYRVLKKDGVCFVSVPLSGNYETLENPEYNTPELRLKHYYQEDHLRLFGFDIKEKLESVGFNVKQYTIDDLINDEKYKEIYGLKSKFNYFVCTKE